MAEEVRNQQPTGTKTGKKKCFKTEHRNNNENINKHQKQQ